MKSKLQRAVETVTVLSAAEICDRVLRKTAGNDVSSTFNGQSINETASSLTYAGLSKGIATVGSRK